MVLLIGTDFNFCIDIVIAERDEIMITVNTVDYIKNDYDLIKGISVPAEVSNEIAYPLEHAINPNGITIINANKFDEREMHEECTWAMNHIANSHTPICDMHYGIPFERRRHTAMMIGLIADDYDGCGDEKTKTGNPVALRSLATELAGMCLDVYLGMPSVHYSSGKLPFMPYMELAGMSEAYQATASNLGIDKITHQKAKSLIDKAISDDDDKSDASGMIRFAMHIVNYLGYAYENAIRREIIENELYRAYDNGIAPSDENRTLMQVAKDAIILYTKLAPHIGSLTDKEACHLIDDIVEIMRKGIEEADSIVGNRP